MDRPPRPVVDITASCACGAISLRVAGTVRSMFMCACLDCQKATGTGHSTVALVSRDTVTLTGAAKSFSRPAASGAVFTRHFCPACGTPLYGQSSRAPEMLMLSTGLFAADADWFAPNQLIFARSHHEWDEIAAHLPRYQTYRDEEPTP